MQELRLGHPLDPMFIFVCKDLLFNYGSQCVPGCGYVHICVGAHGSQKKVLGPIGSCEPPYRGAGNQT